MSQWLPSHKARLLMGASDGRGLVIFAQGCFDGKATEFRAAFVKDENPLNCRRTIRWMVIPEAVEELCTTRREIWSWSRVFPCFAKEALQYNSRFHKKHKRRETGGRPAVSMLTLFGLFAVSAMLVTYALEQRSPRFILAFAVSCALGSVYGFLQGAWPFGVVEAIWSTVALGRWQRAKR
jgi:hypothetical protein